MPSEPFLRPTRKSISRSAGLTKYLQSWSQGHKICYWDNQTGGNRILLQQEGFRLDPRVHVPSKTAGPGPTLERCWAMPVSENSFLISYLLWHLYLYLTTLLEIYCSLGRIHQSPRPPFGLTRVGLVPLLREQAAPGLSPSPPPTPGLMPHATRAQQVFWSVRDAQGCRTHQSVQGGVDGWMESHTPRASHCNPT